MEYHVEIVGASVVICRLTGKYDRNHLSDAFSECQKHMAKLQNYRLLFDSKEVSQVFSPDPIESETERIRIANKMISAFGQCKDVKIAAVVDPKVVNHFVQFLVKRKGIQLELFDNLKEAKKWVTTFK